MPDIYTSEGYEAVREAMNASARRLGRLPGGSFLVAIEIEGDGRSPYVAPDGERRFVVRIDEGSCTWYREVDSADEEHRQTGGHLDYRFRGRASDFDALAAGLLDPIEAALRGTISVRGDMRLLLRHAEHVKALLEAYATAVDTTWPLGRPPHEERPATGTAPRGEGVPLSA